MIELETRHLEKIEREEKLREEERKRWKAIEDAEEEVRKKKEQLDEDREKLAKYK